MHSSKILYCTVYGKLLQPEATFVSKCIKSVCRPACPQGKHPARFKGGGQGSGAMGKRRDHSPTTSSWIRRCSGRQCNAQFTPAARHDKTVLSVSPQIQVFDLNIVRAIKCSYNWGDSDVISMPVGFRRHHVSKTTINVFRFDISLKYALLAS